MADIYESTSEKQHKTDHFRIITRASNYFNRLFINSATVRLETPPKSTPFILVQPIDKSDLAVGSIRADILSNGKFMLATKNGTIEVRITNENLPSFKNAFTDLPEAKISPAPKPASLHVETKKVVPVVEQASPVVKQEPAVLIEEKNDEQNNHSTKQKEENTMAKKHDIPALKAEVHEFLNAAKKKYKKKISIVSWDAKSSDEFLIIHPKNLEDTETIMELFKECDLSEYLLHKDGAKSLKVLPGFKNPLKEEAEEEAIVLTKKTADDEKKKKAKAKPQPKPKKAAPKKKETKKEKVSSKKLTLRTILDVMADRVNDMVDWHDAFGGLLKTAIKEWVQTKGKGVELATTQIEQGRQVIICVNLDEMANDIADKLGF